jgi:hypothetical protein
MADCFRTGGKPGLSRARSSVGCWEAQQLRLVDKLAHEWGLGSAKPETKRQLSGRQLREARQIRIREAGWRLIRGGKA